MKALIFNFKKKEFKVKNIPNPVIKKGYVLLEIKNSSLCATDLHIMNGPLKGKAYNKKEIILGHSFSGKIKDKSKDVKKFKINERVFGSNFIWCSNCDNCGNNRENLCNNRYIFGMEIPGSHAELLSVPKESIFRLPKGIDFETGSLICDLLGLAINSYKKVLPDKKDKIIVFGLGPVGMTIINLLIAYGFEDIFIVEPRRYRQRLGKKMFKEKIKIINIIKNKDFLDIADIVFETSGSEDALKKSFISLKRGGKLALVGVHDKKFSINTIKWLSRELSLFGIFDCKKSDTEEALKLILNNKINLKKIITHSFELEEGEKAYNLVKSCNCGRVIFNVNDN